MLGVGIIYLLMCAFLIEDANAAVKKGTTTRKEQTVKVELKKGVCVIIVKDKDSWVYAHLQKRGGNKKRAAIAGRNVIAPRGKRGTVAVPIREKGTYYVYLHGKNKGAKYTVRRYAPGGTLKNKVPKLGTSYMDNTTYAYYKFVSPGRGKLRIQVKDASYHYPGYSRVRLRKNKKDLVADESLISGYGYATTYGIGKGVYYIGVRSSSEVYRILAKYSRIKTRNGGKTMAEARDITKPKKVRGVIFTGNKDPKWYKILLPKSKKGKKATLRFGASNNNADIYSSVQVRVYYYVKKNKKYKLRHKTFDLDNSSDIMDIKMRRKRTRKVFIRIKGMKGVSGTYKVSWSR